MKGRERMIQLLTEQYERWEEEEHRNIKNGSGMRGSSGDLSMYTFYDLFNEVAWRLNVMCDIEILEKLKELKQHGEVFNQLTGSLYSNIEADKINDLVNDLKENYGIDIDIYQWMPGRADFSHIDRLIEQYDR